DIYQDEARFAEAGQLYRESISLLLHQPGQSHALAVTWRNLAGVLIAEGQYSEALAALTKASKLGRANKLMDPQLNAQILNSQGVIVFYQGEFGKAKTLFKRAMEITLVATQSFDLTAEDILNNLGGAYHLRRQYAKAEETYKRALKLLEVSLGAAHPRLVVP